MRGPSVSYVLPYHISESNGQRHKFGVNKLLCCSRERLYGGCRDSTLRVWDTSDARIGAVPQVKFTGYNHSDWINDMIMLKSERHAVTCSNDNTIMIWDMEPDQEKHLMTIRAHGDYAKCLAYAPAGNVVASAGYDSTVLLWDMEMLMSTFATQKYYPHRVKPQKNSIYTLAMTPTADLLVTGGADHFVRLYDPRTCGKIAKLRGHQDTVKSVLVKNDASLVVSGSSDGTIKLWDTRQMNRCVHTYATHSDSVWTLAFDTSRSQDYVVSGGRDRNVYYIDLHRSESKHLLRAEAPVLSLAIEPDREHIWVSTTNHLVSKWYFKHAIEEQSPMKPLRRHTIKSSSASFSSGSRSPSRSSGDDAARAVLSQFSNERPVCSIAGEPGIVQAQTLNDRQRVLCRDSAGNVSLWNVTNGRMEQFFGDKVSFDEKYEELFQLCNVPSWFSVKTAMGSLQITLDPPSCFSGDVYAIDAGIDAILDDDKVNLGVMILRALFRDWFRKRRSRVQALEEQRQRLEELEKELDSSLQDQKEQVKAEEAMGKVPSSSASTAPAPAQQATSSEAESGSTAVAEEQPVDRMDESDDHQVLEESSSNVSNEVAQKQEKEEVADTAEEEELGDVGNAEEEDGTLDRIEDLYAFTLPGDTAVIVHHEKLNPALYPFKKLLMDFVGNEMEYKAIPRWVVEVMPPTGQPSEVPAPQKISFFLESFDAANDLPHLKESKSKLHAQRILKVRRVCSYVVQGLQLHLPTWSEWRKEQATLRDKLAARALSPVPVTPSASSMPSTPSGEEATSYSSKSAQSVLATRVAQFQDSLVQKARSLFQAEERAVTPRDEVDESTDVFKASNTIMLPEEYIEISINGMVLEPQVDLGTINVFLRGHHRNVVLQYRRRILDL